MHPRLPLSAKILCWFFLNVTLLATVFILLFNAQFHFDLNWLLSSTASARVDALRDLISDELSATDPEEWDRVMDRFSEAYHVRLTLLDEQGNHLIGPLKELPKEVRNRLSLPHAPPLEAPGGTPAKKQKPFRLRPLRDLVRTAEPTHYWLLVTMRLDSPQAGGTMNAILVADNRSLSMGGLIVDVTPWLRLGLGAIAFSVLFWFPLLRGIAHSIRRITEATRQIAEGRFDVRVASSRRDELGALAEAINQMAGRLDGLVKGQKRFLGDVAHELCAPLARLQLTLGIIEQRADERQKNHIQSATEKAEQIASLVNELLTFSKASLGTSVLQLQQVGVRAVVDEVVRREMSENDEIHIDVPGGLFVLGDHDLLIRALANLLRNAIRHNARAGAITIHASRNGDTAAICVGDCGPGVPEEELSKIFDAFYRLDTARTRETGGIGLGLTIVRTCVESCGGSVTARNRIPAGLEVIIHLPIHPDPAPVPSSHQTQG
jgi:two-component system sensor histidine kinase CpxA